MAVLTNILLVENDPADAFLVERALSSTGLQTVLHQAGDGDEALGFLEEGSALVFDLVLLDWNLPRLHGSQVLSTIRSDPRLRELPVVVLSGSDSAEDADSARALGANEYATKCADFEGMKAQLVELVHAFSAAALKGALESVGVRTLTPRRLPGIAEESPELLVGELIETVRRSARQVCRMLPQNVREDAECAAMIGLMEALRHYPHMESNHFQNYLRLRVRGAIRDEARRFDPLSRRARELVRRVERTMEQHRLKHGVEPDIDELARALGIDEDKCWEALELSEIHALPIDDDTLPYPPETPEDQFVESYAATALRWALSKLDTRSRLVLRLWYKRGLPATHIAQRLSLSTARIHQIRVEAEQRLGKLIRNSPPVSRMQCVNMPFDWDDHTGDTLRSDRQAVSKTDVSDVESTQTPPAGKKRTTRCDFS